MYNLDSQFHFNSDEGVYKLGLWLCRKVLLCEEKLKEAEEILQACGLPYEVLRREWNSQIKSQTKPLPCKSALLVCNTDSYRPTQGNVKIEGNPLSKTPYDCGKAEMLLRPMLMTCETGSSTFQMNLGTRRPLNLSWKWQYKCYGKRKEG